MTKNEIERMKKMDPWTFFSKTYDESNEIENFSHYMQVNTRRKIKK